jgi:hypothetical protein
LSTTFKHGILIKIVNSTNNSVPYPVALCIVMNGVDISIISCDCVTDLGGVSHTHVIFRTPILSKKITYHRKVVGSVIGEDVSDTGNISVSDLSYLSTYLILVSSTHDFFPKNWGTEIK